MLTHFKNTHALVEHSRISHALCVLSLYPFIVYVCFLNVKNSLIDISSANISILTVLSILTAFPV